jgi:2-oxoglutarate dehydrogenase E2 component (dihydrolipoamide succinyltransferase)
MGQIVDVRVPTEDQDGTTSTLLRWLKQRGEEVRQHEPLLELATDKATVEIAAPVAGVLCEQLVAEGTQVEPGELLGRVEAGAIAATTDRAPAAAAPRAEAGNSAGANARDGAPASAALLSPAVRALIAEHGLDPAAIRGTGRGGRITHQDVLDQLANRQAAAPPAGASSGGVDRTSGPSRRVPHTPMRITIASRMVDSALRTAPHVTAVHECDLSAVIAHRDAQRTSGALEGVRLTFTAYFVQAASAALAAVPQVNARWHDDAIELFEDHNIGLATALGDEGLIVPVIPRVQTLDLPGIARAVEDFSQRARAGTLKPKETQGGTFSITNHGMGGSLIATPIIPQPQAAILGIGKLQKRAVVVEANGADQVVIRPMVYVTLTIDHRVLDGFVANRFLAAFVERLERWN